MRVPDDVWLPAHEAANRRGDNLSGIMRDSLAAFVMLTDDEWGDLSEVAEDTGISRPELFSTAINEWVQRHK